LEKQEQLQGKIGEQVYLLASARFIQIQEGTIVVIFTKTLKTA